MNKETQTPTDAPEFFVKGMEERVYWGCWGKYPPEVARTLGNLVILYTSPEEAVKSVLRLGGAVDKLESFTIESGLDCARQHGDIGVRIKDKTGAEYPVIFEVAA